MMYLPNFRTWQERWQALDDEYTAKFEEVYRGNDPALWEPQCQLLRLELRMKLYQALCERDGEQHGRA